MPETYGPKPEPVSFARAGQTPEGAYVGDEHTPNAIPAQYFDASIQALAQVADAELGGQEELMPKKAIEDLSQGFRLTPTHRIEGIKESSIHVVTRFGDDVFAVELASRTLEQASGISATVEGSIRRKRDIPWPQKGSASQEVWKVHKATPAPRTTSYFIETKKGGELEEQEFWRRYDASTVDTTATREYAERLAQRQREYQAVTLTWIQEETPHPLTSQE